MIQTLRSRCVIIYLLLAIRFSSRKVEGCNKNMTIKSAVYGSKNDVKDKKALSAARIYRTWHLYVGSLSLHTSAEEIKEFLVTNGVTAVNCKTVPNSLWQDGFGKAMHVVVKFDDKEKFITLNFWDKGV